MNPLVVLANEKKIPSGDANRPERPHECFSCHRFYDDLVAREKVKEFPCRCKLSTDIQLSETDGLTGDFTTEERVFLEYAVDPVSWAEFELNWTARWYQEEILRCSSLLKVIRAGRRVGKTDALGVDALHKACTSSNFRVLVIAPYQDQVDLIFDRLDKLIEGSMTLKNTVTRRAKHPSQRIEFSNGSVIMGATAGVKTGARANKIRGQDAHAIYLDETDMLAQEDLESILAILASHKHCYLWASGTPSGKREHFYQWCTNKSLKMKEFHYPSSVSPEWTLETETWLRSTYSAAAFAQEFLADFGAEERGVFPKGMVDEQVREYDLAQRQPQKGFVYGIGVDWNDETHGVHMVVVSWNPYDGKFWLERRVVVSRLEFTQTKAIEKIIELNAYWNPAFIYVDQGYGNTQVEILKQYGIQHPQSGILRKLKGIQMGSKVQMQDPFLGSVDKEVKPFVVNLSVRRIEQDECVLPKSEFKGEGTEGLVDQMLKFRIKRFSPDGRPVYDQTPDHTLTAWMLAIYGFWMEHGGLGKRRSSNKVGIIHGEQKKSDDLPPAMGMVKFEIPAERAQEKKVEKMRGTLAPRTAEPVRKARNLTDIRAQRDAKAQMAKRIGTGGRLGFYSYLARSVQKRKTI